MRLTGISNAAAYGAAIKRYASETGKSIGEALEREGPDFKFELFRQFHAIHPNPRAIYEAAKARGFAVSRNASTFLVPTEGGLSARALMKARDIMGGQKSDFFRWVGDRLVNVRFSKNKRHRVLSSRRNSVLNAYGGLRAYQIPASALQEQQQSTEWKDTFAPKRLNLRALAVYLELLYRKRAAQGGTMAVQWLFQTWVRGNSSHPRHLVQRSKTGIPIGTVDFETSTLGHLQAIVFKGFVPGTGEEASTHGIMEKVYANRTAALLNAIKMHQDKLARLQG